MTCLRQRPIESWEHSKIVAAVSGMRRLRRARGACLRTGLSIGLLLCATPVLLAEHAKIDLHVSGEGMEVTADADQEPPPGGRNDPPVLNVKVNAPLTLQFILTNKYPHHALDHVTVRYYVVRVAKLGRKPAPPLRRAEDSSKEPHPLLEKDVVTRGQFTLNLKPDGRVGTRLKFQIAAPGIYSARVETLNTQSDHEHFSAIDLVAE